MRGSMQATTSPGPTPWAFKTLAKRAARSRSSTKVTVARWPSWSSHSSATLPGSAQRSQHSTQALRPAVSEPLSFASSSSNRKPACAS